MLCGDNIWGILFVLNRLFLNRTFLDIVPTQFVRVQETPVPHDDDNNEGKINNS